MNVIVALALIGLAALAGRALLHTIPDSLVSLFRYRLWALRDTIVDEILGGLYQDRRAAVRVAREVELVIDYANELTMFKFFVFNRLARDPDLPRYEELTLDELSATDRERLARHLDELYSYVGHHAFLGSPSGWVSFIALFPYAAVVGLIRYLRNRGSRKDSGIDSLFEEAKHAARSRADIQEDLEDALTVLRRRDRRLLLAA